MHSNLHNSTRYAFIGDIHSQVGPLLRAIEYCDSHGLTPIFLGDLFDSRIEHSSSVEVYREIRNIQESWSHGQVEILRSNHQNKFERYAQGRDVKMCQGFGSTVSDFEQANVSVEEVADWLNTFPYGVCLRDPSGQEYRAAHAMFPSWIYVPSEYNGIYRVNEVTRKAKDYMIYGPRRPGTTWPQEEARVFWWEEDSNRDWVRVAGHYHHVFVGDKSLVLDGDMGGSQDRTDTNQISLCLYNVEDRNLVQFPWSHG
jgi:hypothetical protein